MLGWAVFSLAFFGNSVSISITTYIYTLQYQIDGGDNCSFLDFYYGGGQLDTFETFKLKFSKIRFSTPNNGQNFY